MYYVQDGIQDASLNRQLPFNACVESNKLNAILEANLCFKECQCISTDHSGSVCPS